MLLARLRGAAVGGLVVLLLSGAGVVFANSPVPTTPSAPTPTPVTVAAPAAPPAVAPTAGDQQVDVQQGDQTAPDPAGAAATEQSGVEAPEATAESSGAAAEAAGSKADGPSGHADPGQNAVHQCPGQCQE